MVAKSWVCPWMTAQKQATTPCRICREHAAVSYERSTDREGYEGEVDAPRRCESAC